MRLKYFLIISFFPALCFAQVVKDFKQGANGRFVLYKDENDNYNYEKGVYSTITFNWNDAKKVLTINKRKGAFPGMLTERKFNIVLVSENNGIGMELVEKFDKVITYNGKKVEIKL